MQTILRQRNVLLFCFLHKAFKISSAIVVFLVLALLFTVVHPMTASAATRAVSPSQQISIDPYSGNNGQHDPQPRTEVEPSAFAFGNQIVTAFQIGRYTDQEGGSYNVGFSTSNDRGRTWIHNVFSCCITKGGGGSYDRITNNSVTYDAKHHVWMIANIGFDADPTGNASGRAAVIVSRSPDGYNWKSFWVISSDPTGVSGYDKDLIVCDNFPQSPHYGNCYAEWDETNNRATIDMSVSLDGGVTWGPIHHAADSATGLGGQLVVQPNGTVVVLYSSGVIPLESPITLNSFYSVDGGTTWSSRKIIASVDSAGVRTMRSPVLPSAAIDSSGKIYVVWHECQSDICNMFLATSVNGAKWDERFFPINDHNEFGFLPSIGIDPTTSGTHAHIGVVYYSLRNFACPTGTCFIKANFISSIDGGASWYTPQDLTGYIPTNWLAVSDKGYMVGDYVTMVFVFGVAHPIYAFAHSPCCGASLNEAIYTNTVDVP